MFDPCGHVAAELSCGFRRRWRATEVRRRTHREHQPATAFATDLVKHFAHPLDQRVHLCDTFVRRAVLEETREAIEVKFDTVAVVALDGFLDEPRRVVADLGACEVHCPAALVLFDAQPPIGMVGQKLRPQEVNAMVIVHAKRQQRFAAAPLCFGQHDRVRIDARIEERFQIGEPLLFRCRPFRSFFWSGMSAAHRADFRRIVHDLRVDADQHRIDAAPVVSHLFNQPLHVVNVDLHRAFAIGFCQQARIAVEVVEDTPRSRGLFDRL